MKVKRKNQTIKVKYPAGEGYNPDIVNKTALKVKDQGNGYLIEFKAFSSTYLPKMFSLDYAEAEYLYLALQEFMKEERSEDGWTKWYGKASLPKDLCLSDLVEVRLEEGTVLSEYAHNLYWWRDENPENNIVAYRKV